MTLYDADFFAWTEEQAGKLRQLANVRSNVDLDLLNLIEEIESLGSEQIRAVESALKRVVEHLLKLEFSPSGDPRGGWVETISTQRTEIEDRLRRNPSLASPERLEDSLPWAWRQGRRLAIRSLTVHGEPDAAAAIPAECPYTLEQLLDFDWLPANRHGL